MTRLWWLLAFIQNLRESNTKITINDNVEIRKVKLVQLLFNSLQLHSQAVWYLDHNIKLGSVIDSVEALGHWVDGRTI